MSRCISGVNNVKGKTINLVKPAYIERPLVEPKLTGL